MTRRRPRVLIADDDQDIRALIQAMLDSAGLTSTAVDGGLAALQHARNEPADLYVIDIQMPDMNGIELTRQLKSEVTPGARVLIVSAQTSAADIAAALAAGSDGFLAKPFTRTDLLEQVGALLIVEPHPCPKRDAL